MLESQESWPTPDGHDHNAEAARALIAARPAFAALPPAVHARLAMLARVRAYADGEALLRAGEAGRDAYLILRGLVRLDRAHAAPLAVGPGAVLSGLPDPATGRLSHSARAVGSVEALAFGHLALGVTMLQFPEAAETLREAFRNADAVQWTGD